MNIYSNSYFHRVKYENTIEAILEQGFKVFYCREEIFRGKNKAPTYIGIPMVSFCDIPLSLISKNHYGKYGIALSRSWGKKKHLEPVLYYPNDVGCQSTKMIIRAADNFIQDRNNSGAYRILGYSKPMEKPTKKEGQSSDNYAEREWRKVYANPVPLKWLTEEEYVDYRGDENEPKQPVGNILCFKANDIDFILVKNKTDVLKLQKFIMKQLKHIGGNKDDAEIEEKWLLLTKIIVYEDLLHNL